MNGKLVIRIVFILTAVFSGFAFSACSKSASVPTQVTAEDKQKMEGFDALEAKKAEYTAIPAKEQLSKEPYRKKSLLVYKFDPAEKEGKDKWRRNYFGTDKFGTTLFSKDYEKLESNLAKNPAEVGTIALMPECKQVHAGQYGSTAAFQEQCELVLIDPELSAVVYRKTFVGEMDSSKSVSKSESSVMGRVNGNDIIDFLYALKTK
jgi:hypothetical protein